MTPLRLSRRFRQQFDVRLEELPEDLPAIRRLIAAMEPPRHAAGLEPLQAGQLQAAWLINAALNMVVQRYCERLDQQALQAARQQLEATLGREGVERILAAYAEAFDAPRALEERDAGLEAVLLLWLAAANPAMKPMRELFDDQPLCEAGYERLIATLAAHFQERPPFGPDDQPLITMLRSPAIAVPDSLRGQLAYIRERWADLLGDLLDRLLLAMDVLAEEERALWLRMHPLADPAAGAAAAASVYHFGAFESEPEGFTPDHDWHPRVVLMAKNAHVWLDQLSKRYQRDCQRLDQIPDEELDRLSAWGVTGLWLIGIWQRSRASERIKRLRGNPDAAASAYALEDYRVADELGGEGAWAELSERAWRRGLRLASDMVPNHMGVDSSWVIEHPDWFLSLPDPPYPGYTFNGPDLSEDGRASIYIEDHYWDGSDAAVVFKRVDRASGETRYIYHGNDGTSFPWNDTAQLDYIRAEVREQVIQTILSVARRFPIIRFDAAMVLARRHIRRLWWPEPGSGGGTIPSRAEHALSQAEFDRLMPAEFWREVVDRVKAEGLETLLLAEAFWLLEGYFVRTLGMHRVYNSAFMHMLRDERNAEYRLVMKNTLEFDPEVLKRYVNFMNNPDEKPAVEQFGKGDKYFGVCTLLATLPGLPMFGHGQVEGFSEKYGMEYRRAYYDEQADGDLVARHEREIFPLLRRRAQFGEVGNFLLYDFVADGGWVNEDVFAYSNGLDAGRSLIVYHNRYASTSGIIRESVAFSQPDGSGGRRLVRRSLADGLGLPADDDELFVTFRDHMSGLEYVRSARELHERGLWLSLGAYGRHAFLDFQQQRDASGLWRRMAEHLNGRGTASLTGLMDELLLEPVRTPFGQLVSAGTLRAILAAGEDEQQLEALLQAAGDQTRRLAEAARAIGAEEPDPDLMAAHVTGSLRVLCRLAGRRAAPEDSDRAPAVSATAVATALAVQALAPFDAPAGQLIDGWRLAPVIAAMFRGLEAGEGLAWRRVEVVRSLASQPAWPRPAGEAQDRAGRLVTAWLADATAHKAIGVNQHGGVLWFRAEAFDEFVDQAIVLEAVRRLDEGDVTPERLEGCLSGLHEVGERLHQMAISSGYRVDQLARLASPAGSGGLVVTDVEPAPFNSVTALNKGNSLPDRG